MTDNEFLLGWSISMIGEFCSAVDSLTNERVEQMPVIVIFLITGCVDFSHEVRRIVAAVQAIVDPSKDCIGHVINDM